jgi:hypothetical protein
VLSQSQAFIAQWLGATKLSSKPSLLSSTELSSTELSSTELSSTEVLR